MTRAPRRAVIAPLAMVLLALAAPAAATFLAGQDVGSNTFTTAALVPPTGVTATAVCRDGMPNVDLTWAATPSSFADGYDVYRATNAGGPYSKIDHVPGAATSSYTDGGTTGATTYYYVLQATALSWTSSSTSEVAATTQSSC